MPTDTAIVFKRASHHSRPLLLTDSIDFAIEEFFAVEGRGLNIVAAVRVDHLFEGRLRHARRKGTIQLAGLLLRR